MIKLLALQWVIFVYPKVLRRWLLIPVTIICIKKFSLFIFGPIHFSIIYSRGSFAVLINDLVTQDRS